MTSLLDKAILSGAENRPPMLENDMYDSCKSIMELYMLNIQHGRMILESFENGPLPWPTVEENGVTRTKKYSELSTTEAIQAECDVKATNIILQGLPPEVYALESTHKVAKKLWERIQMLIQGTSLTKQERECKLYDEFDKFAYKKGESLVEYALVVHQQSKFFQPDTGLVVPVFQKGDDPIDAINHMMSFLTVVVTSWYPPTDNQLRTSSNLHQQATINNGRVTIQPIQGSQNFMNASMSRQYTSGPSGTSGKQRVIVCYNCKGEGHMSKQCTKPKRKIDEAWFKDTVLLVQAQANGQVLHEEEFFGRSRDRRDSKHIIALMTKMSHYGSDNLAENSSSLSQQDDLILSFIEQLKTQVVNCTKINQDNKNVNEILTVELERYKDQYLVNSKEPTLSLSTTIVEVPKELSKVSMVNSSLKKLKSHLASFDVVVKARTTATTITKGTWGFEHTKACFRGWGKIIPFVKALKDLFNSLDQFLIDELTEVQNVFNQMEQAVEQHCVEKNKFQDKMNDVLKENERLLKQAISADIVNIVVHANYTTLTKYCISLEVDSQLKNENFQINNSFSQQSAPTFDQLFKINDLKAQSQEKDTVIMKLKERLKSLSSNVKEEKIKRELEEIETINLEFDHRVTKLVAKNRHLKQTYKQLYDSIKSSRVRSKEQCDDLIKQVNIKPAENSNLNASLQEKV
uniref:CCHC-type domain-containing protein n=1 Tax=Tanacetum cinerariifolium TaxID=118510 RepID=A0A6L2NJL3_TANCI|nr:hypothetical protein [Tanacetum cinerariifolium]